MTNKLLLTSILALFVATFSAQAADFSEGLMGTLQYNELYGMPENQDPEVWLKSLIQLLKQDSQRFGDAETTQLLLGDAYHWLGHVLEEVDRLEEAFVAHTLSLKSYKKANVEYSPGINFHWPEGHANFHLARVAGKLGHTINLEWLGGWSRRVDLPDPQSEIASYGKILRAIEVRVADSKSLRPIRTNSEVCESLFSQVWSEAS